MKKDVDDNESKLDSLKTLGDEIASKGKASLVQPYEKQLYKRWEDLEKKFEFKISDTERKLQQINEKEQKDEEERLQEAMRVMEEEKQKQQKVEIVEEELILTETNRSVESAPDVVLDEAPVNVELVTQDEADNDGMWIIKRQTESTDVKQFAEVKFTVTSKTVEQSKYIFPESVLRIVTASKSSLILLNLNLWKAKLFKQALNFT